MMDLTLRDTSCSPYANGSVSLADLESASSAITGGYTGDSLTLKVLIIFFPGLSMYNAVELLVLIFFTFNKYKGVYFWSLLIASAGVIPYSLGFLLKFANILQGELRWLSIVLLTIGWWSIVTGQSVVLWSRLHLILEGEKGQRTLCWTKWMIIIDAIILHLPTTVLTFGSNGSVHTETFATAYSIMEKIQMSGFFVQEVILSSIYIVATLRILRTSIREHTQKLMWSLMGINIIIIVMDMGMLGLEAASQYLLETLVKGVIYSIKLKLEFAILGQLVKFVGRPGTSVANDERLRRASVQYFGRDANEKASDTTLSSSNAGGFGPGFVSNFAELNKARSVQTQSTALRRESEAIDGNTVVSRQRTRAESVRLPPGMSLDDVDVALFQHTENKVLPYIDAGDCQLTLDIDPPKLEEGKSRSGDDAV